MLSRLLYARSSEGTYLLRHMPLLPAPRTRARAWCCRCPRSVWTGSMKTSPPSLEEGRWAGTVHGGGGHTSCVCVVIWVSGLVVRWGLTVKCSHATASAASEVHRSARAHHLAAYAAPPRRCRAANVMSPQPHQLCVVSSPMQGRKSGLTFAPEAGTQRLRDIINKVRQGTVRHAERKLHCSDVW